LGEGRLKGGRMTSLRLSRPTSCRPRLEVLVVHQHDVRASVFSLLFPREVDLEIISQKVTSLERGHTDSSRVDIVDRDVDDLGYSALVEVDDAHASADRLVERYDEGCSSSSGRGRLRLLEVDIEFHADTDG